MCQTNKTPFLNDLHLFNLENRTWYQVKYTDPSEQLSYLGNHSLAVLSDGDNYERIVVFGGIYNIPHEDVADVKSYLSNATHIMQMYKNQQGSKEHQQMLQFQSNKQENKKFLNKKESSNIKGPNKFI